MSPPGKEAANTTLINVELNCRLNTSVLDPRRKRIFCVNIKFIEVCVMTLRLHESESAADVICPLHTPPASYELVKLS